MFKYTGPYKLTKGSIGSAGYDLRSMNDYTLKAGKRIIVSTGIKISLPSNKFAGRVCGRSGLAFKHGIIAFNGVIDSDYLGEIKVLLYNIGKKEYIIEENDRVAQLVIVNISSGRTMRLSSEEFDEEKEKSLSDRKDKGFGSTGK